MERPAASHRRALLHRPHATAEVGLGTTVLGVLGLIVLPIALIGLLLSGGGLVWGIVAGLAALADVERLERIVVVVAPRGLEVRRELRCGLGGRRLGGTSRGLRDGLRLHCTKHRASVVPRERKRNYSAFVVHCCAVDAPRRERRFARGVNGSRHAARQPDLIVGPMTRDPARIVFITGSTSGIGAACARAFARGGARLVLTGRSREKLDALARDVGDAAPSHVALLDVRDRAAVERDDTRDAAHSVASSPLATAQSQ